MRETSSQSSERREYNNAQNNAGAVDQQQQHQVSTARPTAGQDVPPAGSSAAAGLPTASSRNEGQDGVPIITDSPAADRRPLNEAEFLARYDYQPEPHVTTRGHAKRTVRSFGRAVKHCCTPSGFKQFLFGFLPILSWLPKYSIKNYLYGDVVSGITVAVMHIPQGMAYSLLAGTPAVNGLYMAFFPVIVYVFFCSSRHTSMGTFAVVMLMTGALADDILEKHGRLEERFFYSLFSFKMSGRILTQPLMETEDEKGVSKIGDNIFYQNTTAAGYTQTQVVVVICLAVGLVQVAMGILRLGVLSVILSDVLVSGFTTGASMHVLTSQLKNIFGLPVPKERSFPRLLRTQWFVITHIHHSSLTAIIMSSVAMTIMAIINDHLKPRVAKVTKIPIPIELLAVIFGTLASYLLDMHRKYSLSIIGHLPTGLPAPEVPYVSLLPDVLVGSFVIAIVAYTVSFSMAKILAMKQNYQVDANQELFACGFGDIVGSFFRSGPIAASLSRSLIQQNVGGVTQVTSFVSCALLLLILLFMGPLFYHLPNCILSSIILVALKGMFMQYKHFLQAWRSCKLDALVWMAAFLGVVIIDIDIGLAIGVAFSLLTLALRGQRPYCSLLGEIPTETHPLYVDLERFGEAQEPPGVKIFEFASGIHFANAQYFKNALFRQTGLDPIKWQMEEQAEKKKLEKQKRKSSMKGASRMGSGLFASCCGRKTADDSSEQHEMENSSNIDTDDVSTLEKEASLDVNLDVSSKSHHLPFQYLVIKLSSVGFVDNSAVKALKGVFQEYANVGVVVVFAETSEPVMRFFRAVNLYEEIPIENFFPTMQDAVLCAKVQCLTRTSATDKGNNIGGELLMDSSDEALEEAGQMKT